MKFTFSLLIGTLILALICAGMCPNTAADIWASGKIVFRYNGELAVTSPDGNRSYLLGTRGSDPTWSPRGDEILYGAESSVYIDQWDIWLMDADGSNRRRLIEDAYSPSWGPDGNRFVVQVGKDDRWVLAIYTLNAARDGVVDGPDIVVTGNDAAWPRHPAWSPDGNYIAYVWRESEQSRSLYVYDVAAERNTEIVSGEYSVQRPDWGPRSENIAFSGMNPGYAGGRRSIFIVPRQGLPDEGFAAYRGIWADEGWALYHPTVAPFGGEVIVDAYWSSRWRRGQNTLPKYTFGAEGSWLNLYPFGRPSWGQYPSYDHPDWWHPSTYSVEPRASQLTTTWGQLKKKTQ